MKLKLFLSLVVTLMLFSSGMIDFCFAGQTDAGSIPPAPGYKSKKGADGKSSEQYRKKDPRDAKKSMPKPLTETTYVETPFEIKTSSNVTVTISTYTVQPELELLWTKKFDMDISYFGSNVNTSYIFANLEHYDKKLRTYDKRKIVLFNIHGEIIFEQDKIGLVTVGNKEPFLIYSPSRNSLDIGNINGKKNHSFVFINNVHPIPVSPNDKYIIGLEYNDESSSHNSGMHVYDIYGNPLWGDKHYRNTKFKFITDEVFACFTKRGWGYNSDVGRYEYNGPKLVIYKTKTGEKLHEEFISCNDSISYESIGDFNPESNILEASFEVFSFKEGRKYINLKFKLPDLGIKESDLKTPAKYKVEKIDKNTIGFYQVK
jgi:hypothetical protein